jgi:hypothetical protein
MHMIIITTLEKYFIELKLYMKTLLKFQTTITL